MAGWASIYPIPTVHTWMRPWVVANERLGPALTSNGFGPPPEGREGRIDWILVGGPIDVHSVETVVHSDQGRYPSDHYPVVARIEIGQ